MSAEKYILIFDDQYPNLNWVEDITDNFKCKMFSTGSYEIAKTLFTTYNPEIIICDISVGEVKNPPGLEIPDLEWTGLYFIDFIRNQCLNQLTKLFVYTGVTDPRLILFLHQYDVSYFSKYDVRLFRAELIKTLRPQNQGR